MRDCGCGDLDKCIVLAVKDDVAPGKTQGRVSGEVEAENPKDQKQSSL